MEGQALCCNNLGLVCFKKGEWNAAEYYFSKASR